eukprot:TRINITY_DN11405_c0_g1_i1.p1 TRINITY_DN11405_c0_g1~~TRINITY_DN11405_c0_g1_i1.p1  ORF type:complete len:384 (+),score=102.04 TRINITY_DN11405_c0_g1_i1:47-1198(+)
MLVRACRREYTQEGEVRNVGGLAAAQCEHALWEKQREECIQKVRQQAEENVLSRLQVERVQQKDALLREELAALEASAAATAEKFSGLVHRKTSEAADLRQRLREADALVRAQEADLQRARRRCENLESMELPALRSELQERGRALESLKERGVEEQNAARASVDDLERTFQSTKREAALVRQRLAEQELLLCERASEEKKLRDLLTGERTKAQQAADACETLRPEVESWRKQAEEAANTERELVAKLAAEKERGALDLHAGECAEAALRAEGRELRNALQQLSAEVATYVDRANSAESRVRDYKSRASELRKLLHETEAERSFTNRALTAVQMRNKELEELHNSRATAALEALIFGGRSSLSPNSTDTTPPVFTRGASAGSI